MNMNIKLLIPKIENEDEWDPYSIPEIRKRADYISESKQRPPELKEILKKCSPDENELKGIIDDIADYYEKYFMPNLITNTTPFQKIDLSVLTLLHKKMQEGRRNVCGTSNLTGRGIKIGYINLFLQLKKQIEHKQGLDLEFVEDHKKNKNTLYYDLLYGYWKDFTKPLFFMEIRYVLAHEFFHSMHCLDFNAKSISISSIHSMSEVFAEYFALCYINELCNKTKFQKKEFLWLGDSEDRHVINTAVFSDDDKKNGTIGIDLKLVAYNALNNKAGYDGGALLMALALKDLAAGKKFGTHFGDYQYFTKAYKDLRENACSNEDSRTYDALTQRWGEIKSL